MLAVYTWYPQNDMVVMTFYFCDIPPRKKTIIPVWSWKKTMEKYQLKYSLQNIGRILLKSLTLSKISSLKKCHSQEMPKETGWLNVTCCSGCDSGGVKGQKDIR